MTTQNNTEIFESLAILSINELRELIVEASYLLIEKEKGNEDKQKAVIVSLSQSIGLDVNFH